MTLSLEIYSKKRYNVVGLDHFSADVSKPVSRSRLLKEATNIA